MPVVIMASIFVIVFVISYRSLAEVSLFGKPASAVLAFCVAALSVAGIVHVGSSSSVEPPPSRVVFVPILLPYAALALAWVGVLVLVILMRLFRRWCRRSEGDHQETQVDGRSADRAKPIGANVGETSIRRFE